MNWKFFRREVAVIDPHLANKLKAEVKSLEMQRDILEGTLRQRAEEISRLQAALNFRTKLRSDPPGDAQILSALVVVDETTPLWRAVHRVIDLLELDQKSAVCRPDIVSEARTYNAGRLAMCEELRFVLTQKWTEARKQNEEACRP